jgi:hypothetical protein
MDCYLAQITGGTRDPLPSEIGLDSEISGSSNTAVVGNSLFCTLCCKRIYVRICTFFYARLLPLLTLFYVGDLS